MAFTRVEYERDWTRAADFPAFQDSEAQVRADLQYHPNVLRDVINALAEELEGGNAAGMLGAVNSAGVQTTIQNVLDGIAGELSCLAEDIFAVAAGGVPSVMKNSAVTFTKDSWSVTDGTATLKIARSEHGRESETFGYNLYQLEDGVYRSGTQSTNATSLTYRADGSIALTADEAYSGKIVLFGM